MHADDIAHAHVRACVPDRLRRARQAPGERDSDQQSRQQHGGDEGIDAGRQCGPIEAPIDSPLAGREHCVPTGFNGVRLQRGRAERSCFRQRGHPDDLHQPQGRGGRRKGQHDPMHHHGHRQRGDQHHRPCRHMHTRVAHAQQLQAEPDDAAERERSQCRFQKQRQHHFLPFARATRSVSMRKRLRSSIAVSTIPTRTSSTEPLQNQSTMRWTALAATRPRASVAWYT